MRTNSHRYMVKKKKKEKKEREGEEEKEKEEENTSYSLFSPPPLYSKPFSHSTPMTEPPLKSGRGLLPEPNHDVRK